MTDHSTFTRSFVERYRGELVAFRRHLHAYPEPSWEERETTELISQRLIAAGLKPTVLDGGCGLVCDIGDGSPATGRVVALRADIDALLMDDEKDVPYRSKRRGVSHACGHDVHTTVVLGAGLALAQLFELEGAPGRVRLIFEPAEETLPSGALELIDVGALDGVDAIFGVHCDPKIDMGTIALRDGPLTSAADMIDIELNGPGGHTARPDLTVDLVRVAGRLAADLPDLVLARTAERGELHVVFGMIESGHASNVIPAHAKLRGTVRTREPRLWRDAERIVGDCLAELVRETGASWKIDYRQGIPPVVNHPGETERLRAAARRLVAGSCIVEAPQSLGGDSFAWYAEKVPGSYARLGTHDPRDTGPRRDLHASDFDVDERAIDLGVQLLVLAALDALNPVG